MTSLLHFQQRGYGDNILLIHGLFGRLENLNMVAKMLAAHFCVTSIDVRNHGNSFHNSVMDYATMAQDVCQLLDHLSIKSTIVLGHSMGGKIAMELALTAPKYVERLIVADIAPVKYSPHHTDIIAGLKAVDFSQVKHRRDVKEQLKPYVTEKAVCEFLLSNLYNENGQFRFRFNVEHIDKNYNNILNCYQGSQYFKGKVLFIKGSDSDYILPEHREDILRLFPKSQAKIIQGAGHWLHAEKTIAFNRTVLQFLNIV